MDSIRSKPSELLKKLATEVALITSLSLFSGCMSAVRITSNPSRATVYTGKYYPPNNLIHKVKYFGKTPIKLHFPDMVAYKARWNDDTESHWEIVNNNWLPFIPLPHFIHFDKGINRPTNARIEAPENTAHLRIDTEPTGAKVYEEGEGPQGKTPFTGTYTIDIEKSKRKSINCRPLTFVKEGYFPLKFQPVLKLNQRNRIDPNNYRTYGKESNYHELIFLKRDPNITITKPTPPPHVQKHEYNITTKQEESFLDQSLKFGELMLFMKALTPTEYK